MKKIISYIMLLLGVLFFFPRSLFSQKEDKFLYLPDSLGVEFLDDSTLQFFNSNQRDTTCGASISTPEGFLKYYMMSDPDDRYGAYLNNGNHDLVKGSKGIFQGVGGIRSAMFLPVYGDTNYYHLITLPQIVDSGVGEPGFPFKGYQLSTHLVIGDSVIYKNKLLVERLVNPTFVCTKKIDGKNWYIICFDQLTCKFIIYETEGKNIIGPRYQNGIQFCDRTLDVDMDISGNGRYIQLTDQEEGITKIYLFNRCSGEIAFVDQVIADFENWLQFNFIYKALFSPNGKYLYVLVLYQKDVRMQNTLIQYSWQEIEKEYLMDTIYQSGDMGNMCYLFWGMGQKKLYFNSGDYVRSEEDRTDRLSVINQVNNFGKEYMGLEKDKILLDKTYDPFLYQSSPNYQLGPLTIDQIGKAYEVDTIRVCKNRRILLGDLPYYDGVDYEWFPEDYLSSSTDAQPIFTPPGVGIYTYTLKVEPDFSTCWSGETHTDQVTIIVTDDSTDCHITGRNKTMKKEIDVQMYPNPARDFVKVKFDGESESKLNLEVYDVRGIKVLTQILKNGETEIPVSALSSGAYVFKFTDEKGEMLVHKLLINR